MDMRGLMTSCSLVLLGGCRAGGPSPVGPHITCDDPPRCYRTNGTGVYTAEDAFAGIGDSQLMITHFTNEGSSVTFEGRYRVDASVPYWQFLTTPGKVYGAEHPKTPCNSSSHPCAPSKSVVSVTEASTHPTWILEDPITHAQDPVGPDGLGGLRLFISFEPILSHGEIYMIEFDGPAIKQLPDRRPVSVYGMTWATPSGSKATPYCWDKPNVDPSKKPDPIVFQQGIAVDPLTGKVTRDPNFITMSCYLGAPATVYGWKYDYTGANTFYFDSAIQMKRASYCGNEDNYTVAGTKIQIIDDQKINDEIPIGRLEASWSPTGATCLNPSNVRYPKKPFPGFCKSTRLPPCQAPPGTAANPRFLVDGPE